MRHILNFRLFEGGNALEISRPIKYSELAPTLSAIEQTVFTVIGLQGFGKDCVLIGSAGKATCDETDAGDIDIGVDISAYAESNGITEEQALIYLYNKLVSAFPIFQSKWIRGVDVVSFGFPIANNPGLGYVQVDFIPLKSMEWAKFVYNSPRNSAYKSAHRNWLLCAILSAITEDENKDADGNMISYTGYNMKLGEGLYKVKKSYEGKKGLLKKAKKLSEELVTNAPKDFLDFTVGSGIKSSDIETFEQLIDIIKNPGYKYNDKVETILENCKKFLRRVNLVIPKELNSAGND